MNEYSPNINERPQYEKAPEADVIALHERLLDFADEWPARRHNYPDRVMVEAIADDDELLSPLGEKPVRVHHTVNAVFETYSDTGRSTCVVTVGAEVKRRLIRFDEIDGQVRIGNDLIPEMQAQLYALDITEAGVRATVISMDMRLNHPTTRDMTRYDVQELTRVIDSYLEDASNNESSQYADNE